MRPVKAISLIGAAVLLVCGMAACSPNAAPSASSSSGSSSVSMSVDEAQGEASQAIVLHVEDGTALFVDKNNESVYVPGLPEGQIFGLDGEVISVEQLEPGNIVEVIGNGIMLESYPGQYPGITRIAVVEKGTEADVDPYRDVIDTVFAEQDPYTVAGGHIDYATSQANVSVSMPAVTWEWDTADGFRTVSDGSSFNVDGTLADGTPDVLIESATEVAVGFTMKAMDVQVYAQPITAGPSGGLVLTDADTAATACEVTPIDNGLFSFTAQPATFYTVYGFFDNGNATYNFYAL